MGFLEGNDPSSPIKKPRPPRPVSQVASPFYSAIAKTAPVKPVRRTTKKPTTPVSTAPNPTDIRKQLLAFKNSLFNAPKPAAPRVVTPTARYTAPSVPSVARPVSAPASSGLASEDRTPGKVLTRDDLIQKITRRLSRRGGKGLYDPMIPIEGAPVSDLSDFGQGADPFGGSRFHTGSDISRPAGTPIYAPVGGTISQASPTGGAYGNQIILDHGMGEESMFGHLSGFNVKPGQKVKKGDVIGYVGTTGRSTGNHLHWETWKNGEELDPASAMGRGVPEDILNAAIERYLKKHPDGQNASSRPSGGPSVASNASINSPSTANISGTGITKAYSGTPTVPSIAQAADAGVSGPGVTKAYAGPKDAQEQQSPQQPQPPTNFRAFFNAIATQESGGDYGAVGPKTAYGTALGKYQVLDSNITGELGWDMEALGQEITGEQFLNTPELQDRIAKFKLKDYFKTYGPEGAAKAWYAGPRNATLDSNSAQPGGMPSVNSYADSILEYMRQYLQGE